MQTLQDIFHNRNPAYNADTHHSDRKYILDSGAHPTHINHQVRQMNPLKHPLTTQTATSTSSNTTHHGILKIQANNGFTIREKVIINPDIQENLVSVHSLAKQWGHILFSPTKAHILHTKTTRPSVIGTASWHRNQYILDTAQEPTAHSARTMEGQPKSRTQKPKPTPSHKASPSQHPPHTYTRSARQPATKHTPVRLPNYPVPRHAQISRKDATFYAYHMIFNHLNLRAIQIMAIKNLLPLPAILKQTPPRLSCSGCAHGKQRPQPYKRTKHRYALAVAMSSDVCGPISPKSTHGNQYFVTFIDTNSRYAMVYFTATRKDVLKFILSTIKLVETQHGSPPQIFTTDNAPEYLSKTAKTIYMQHGMTPKPTVPYSPQQNSIAERLNATLVSAARSALFHSNLSDGFWEDALRDATFKYNISRHSSTGKLPFTVWYGHPPPLSQLFCFGQLGTATIRADKKKLHARSFPSRYMYPVDFTNIVVLTLHNGQYKQVRAADFKPYNPLADPVRFYSNAFKCHLPHPDPTVITMKTPAPTSLKQARRYPDSNKWREAHNSELDKIDELQAIKWLPDDQIPQKARLIPLTMNYRYKRSPEQEITEHKARCAVRGDLMKPAIHYNPEHTAAHMADKATIRLLFAIQAAGGLASDHFDIQSAYIHEPYKFDKPVYIRQHPRFDGELKHNCRGGILTKNLYGNPSGGYYYLEGARNYLRSMNYKQSEHDPCLYFKSQSASSFVLIGLCTDDFLVIATATDLIDELFARLKQKYKIKRLGTPSQYLGWKVEQTHDRSTRISQPRHID